MAIGRHKHNLRSPNVCSGIAVSDIDQLKLADIELMVASDAIDLGDLD